MMAGVLEREEEEGTYTLLWWVAWMGGWKSAVGFALLKMGCLTQTDTVQFRFKGQHWGGSNTESTRARGS